MSAFAAKDQALRLARSSKFLPFIEAATSVKFSRPLRALGKFDATGKAS